ncbi:DinB family protein [Brevibacillus ginsengisoli]|uniref:DinB family protein n=1 Tax=Brevibacillus ginsengisoli TaxID=363854 RepID=UPI003CF6DD62
MSKTIIHTAKSMRQFLLHQLQSISEELFDVQPQGFSNTIRWNAGHIAFFHDYFLSLGLPVQSNLSEQYATLFHSGTQPSEWVITPPSKEELIEQLSAQLANMSEIDPSALDELLKSPIEMGPLQFETVGEIVNFSTAHEAMHLATISCLVKAAQS